MHCDNVRRDNVVSHMPHRIASMHMHAQSVAAPTGCPKQFSTQRDFTRSRVRARALESAARCAVVVVAHCSLTL